MQKYMHKNIRQALPAEYDEIYKMGFDVWGQEQELEIYLEGCRQSPKYKQGTWYVLADECGFLYSSLIKYSFADGSCGIGSIATPLALRKAGHASELIKKSLDLFEKEGIKKTFLFSDIGAAFYEKFGFLQLPLQFQQYKDSICMIRGVKIAEIEQNSAFIPPQYF